MEGKKYYTARKLQPRGKDYSYVLEFRHPLSKDNSGKIGKKIRKGLGTKNENEGEKLVEQMNELLSNESYWQPSSRLMAQAKFDPGIVSAFYDEISYILQDYEKVRESKVPLKTKKDGYSQVILLGATGAGKTTLVRQLIGTDPHKERFPATSTARTTVFDTEIILSDDKFKAVVTFYTESETRQFVKEILQKTMSEFYTKKEDSQIQTAFLEDKHQRFRLSYILGKVKKDVKYSKYDEGNEGDELFSDEYNVTDDEQQINEDKIHYYLSGIKSLANKIVEKAKTGLSNLSDEDKKAFDELIHTEFDDYDEDDINEIVDEIIADIKERFNQLKIEELETEKFGWPIYWYHENEVDERDEFIESILFFSSNSASLFGKLLTPLVSGMRVEGKFAPKFLAETPKLVLIDGEGLGHIPDTSDSLPVKTLKRFNECDAILLVDNSQSPMLSAPSAVIKSAALSGHYEKLFLCFTHFDAMKGDNLPTIGMKVNHIFASVDSQLEKLKTELGFDIKKYLSEHLYEHSYYLGSLDQDLGEGNGAKKNRFTIDQIKNLVASLEKIILSPNERNLVVPHYDTSTLILKIQATAIEYHKKWDGYLYGSTLIPKEHFTRIKALSRRLGGADTEYDYLRPISDFYTILIGQISSFISMPEYWSPSNTAEQERQNCINDIRKVLTNKILEYASLHLKNNRINDWIAAYNFRGWGSSYDRSSKIKNIYSEVVRIPENTLNPQTKQFISEIKQIIIDSIKLNGGVIGG